MGEEVAYKPVGTIRPSDANYQTIFQVPNYEDIGVSYKGYSKRKISESSYQLNPQTPRRISWFLTNVAAGSHTTTNRPNYQTTTLYITGINFHWQLASGVFPAQVHIADVDELGSASPKIYQYFFKTGEQNYFLNLRNTPLKFKGKLFDVYTQMALGASDFLQIQVFGWEE